jgi:uroporphyrin-III C-methyltransferase/precorrin-2 dehydrogenase/sirohydrochlorin ferrochelatase
VTGTVFSLPIFVRLTGRPVILIGAGEAAEAKRRLLERAGAVIVGEEGQAALAIVADQDEFAVNRLKIRGIMVNAVDRPDLCDFTLPAIIDRDPVLIAIGTGGVSAGLAAALRQRLETLLPAHLGGLANALHKARARLREKWPDGGARRRALAGALAQGGALDPLGTDPDVDAWLAKRDETQDGGVVHILLRSTDPDDLTLREARWLAQADHVLHTATVPSAILDRARADAPRTPADAPPATSEAGLTVWLEMTA